MVTLRPFNTYGPRQSARAVISTIISQVAAGKTEILLGALDPTRDFNFVADTANAFAAARQRADAGRSAARSTPAPARRSRSGTWC